MNLEGVEKTMLLTLYTKAKHSQQKNHKFFDFKAIDVISEIDYDFSIADKDYQMQWGVISRTIVLDDMVSKYIRSHPRCFGRSRSSWHRSASARRTKPAPENRHHNTSN